MREKIDVSEQSEQIRELYRELAESAESRSIPNQPQGLSEDEKRFAVSQWTMTWRRFRRNKAAMIGAVVVVFYYLIAAFGDFVAPYTLTQRFTEQIYLPPQQIHFFDEGQFHPFVYGVATEFDANLKTYPCHYRRKDLSRILCEEVNRINFLGFLKPTSTCFKHRVVS